VGELKIFTYKKEGEKMAKEKRSYIRVLLRNFDYQVENACEVKRRICIVEDLQESHILRINGIDGCSKVIVYLSKEEERRYKEKFGVEILNKRLPKWIDDVWVNIGFLRLEDINVVHKKDHIEISLREPMSVERMFEFAELSSVWRIDEIVDPEEALRRVKEGKFLG
jgi:hypothetical protein